MVFCIGQAGYMFIGHSHTSTGDTYFVVFMRATSVRPPASVYIQGCSQSSSSSSISEENLENTGPITRKGIYRLIAWKGKEPLYLHGKIIYVFNVDWSQIFLFATLLS